MTPPAQEPVEAPPAPPEPAAPQKTETVNQVQQTSVQSSYEREGRGTLDQPKTDEGKEIAAAKQQLFGSLGALGPGGKIDGAPVEQRAQEIQGLLQKAGVPAEKAATAGDVLKSYQATLAAGGHDASGLESAIGRAEKAGVLTPSDAGTVREIAYANLPEAAAANAARSSGGALQNAISQAESGKLPNAAELRDLLERGGVEHKYAQAAANAVRHLERAEEASSSGDAGTVKAELGFLQSERAKAVKGGALTGPSLAALDAAVTRLQGGPPAGTAQGAATTNAPAPAATAPDTAGAKPVTRSGAAAESSAAPATPAPNANGTAPTSSTAAATAPKPGSPIELPKELLTKAGSAAAPELQAAAKKAASGDYAGALDALGRAGKSAGTEVVTQVASKIADRLPETGAGGVARAVLKDQKAVTAVVTDPALRTAVGKLAGGDFSAIKDIASSPAGAAVTDAALNSAPVKAGLDKLGLTPADAKTLAKGLPDLLKAGEAVGRNDFSGALSALGDAAKQVGPEPVAKVISKVADRLPETGAGGVARAVLKDQKAVSAVLTDPALRTAVGKLAGGDLSALKDIASSPAGAAVTDAALNSAPVKAGLDKLGLTPADAKSLAKGVPDLIKAGEALGSGKIGDALAALGDAAKQVGPEPIAKLASKIGATLPQSGPGGVARAILQDQKAVTALLTDQKLPAAVGKLAGGDLSALKDIASSPAGGAVIDAALASPPLKAGLDKLGLTADDVKAAGRALPDLLKAGEALGKGDATGALRALGDAATAAGPDAATKAITKAAAALPETGALGVARALLSDQALVKKVLTNPETRKAFDAIASGKPDQAAAAVGTLLKDPSVRDSALGALANDKQLLSKLAPLGIKDAK
ncbi:MAG TPA: hypothetical protein VFA20_26285, partial [Myxococcaceae bacterium]|nr:hypothetical protein [Myxococcaceae bacterium]